MYWNCVGDYAKNLNTLGPLRDRICHEIIKPRFVRLRIYDSSLIVLEIGQLPVCLSPPTLGYSHCPSLLVLPVQYATMKLLCVLSGWFVDEWVNGYHVAFSQSHEKGFPKAVQRWNCTTAKKRSTSRTKRGIIMEWTVAKSKLHRRAFTC